MSELKIGDWVYVHDWCYGQIMDLTDEEATVEFETYGGGGSMSFDITDLRKAPEPNSYVLEKTQMKFCISEPNSTGRIFDYYDDFIKALEDLVVAYSKRGEEYFVVEVSNG